jgi:hypothetical protein
MSDSNLLQPLAHTPPNPLHRQIKVLHEALARIFFHAFKHKRDRKAPQARHHFTCSVRWALTLLSLKTVGVL